MPIYEIRCHACGQTAEVMVSRIADNPSCPSCGSNDTQKLMSAPRSLSGTPGQHFPGPGDTACYGQKPHLRACDGPGSCCGRESS